MLMKALQVIQPRSFASVQVPVPRLTFSSPDRILVRPSWVSMCGSDIPFFTGSKRFKPCPLAPGAPIHECAGQVIESTSDLFQPGDYVVAIPEGDQGLAEFFVAQAAKTVRLPPDLTGLDTSCLNAQRCRVAEELGATQTFPMRSIEVIHAARQSPSVWKETDVCIEAVGHQMDTLNDCFALVRKRGTVVAFGVPDHPVYAIEFETFFRKNAHLIAVVTPEWSEYLTRTRDLFLAHRDELETLATHRFSIQDAAKAFTLYERHEQGVLKALLDASYWETNCE